MNKPQHDARGGWSLKALSAVIVWGLSFVASRIVLEWLTPVGLVSTRLWISALCLVGAVRLMGVRLLPPRSDLMRCTILGLILALHLWIQSVGLQWTTATNTSWIIAFSPIVIAIGAVVFLKEPLGRRGWIGAAIGAAGVTVVSLSRGLNLSIARFGYLLQLMSCVTWAAYTLLAVSVLGRAGSLTVSTFSVATAAVALTPFAIVMPCVEGEMTLHAVVGVVFLGLICSGLAYWLWYGAVRDVGSASAGVYLYIEPFVTLVAAWIMLGERMGLIGMAGGLAVLVGVWVVASKKQTTE